MGPSLVASTPVTLLAVAKSVAGSVFFMRDKRSALTLSAVFLICFLVIHALGNLGILQGKDALNTYGYMLVANPVLPFIEGYLLLLAVIHLLAALYIWATSKSMKSLTSKDMAMGTSGTILLAFIVTHLMDFRFGPVYPTELPGLKEDPYTGGEVKARDLHRLQLEVLADPMKAALYIAGVLAVASHLYYGWRTAVFKIGLPAEHIKNATLIGHTLNFALSSAFIVAVAASHLKLP